MALADWEQRPVFEGWEEANGSTNWAFGDNWRLALINPVILHVANLVNNGFDSKHTESLYHEIAKQREGYFKDALSSVDEKKNAFDEWHKNPFRTVTTSKGPPSPKPSGEELAGVKLLDIGCGEAYRGRWLGRFGLQYLGVDGSRRFIETAEKRRKNLERDIAPLVEGQRYEVHDLSVSSFDFSDLNFTPNLAIAVTVFDHLPQPIPLLKKLSAFLANSAPNAPLLVVCLNPRHFESDIGLAFGERLQDYGEEESHLGMKKDSKIESAKLAYATLQQGTGSDWSTVNVFYRSLGGWERIFTEGNFHVLKVAPLQFSDRTLLNEASSDVYYEAAPFHAWLLYPKPSGTKATLESLKQIFSHERSVFANLHADEANAILDHLQKSNDVRTIQFNAGDPIAHMDNLGGDVFFVLSGTAQLVSKNGAVLESFETGDIIGELESDEPTDTSDKHARQREALRYFVQRYILRVEAASDRTELLVLPKSLFESILRNFSKASLSQRLFQNLKNKLLTNLWIYHSEKDSTDWNKDGFKNRHRELADAELSPPHLNAAAKAIMYAATLEAQREKRTSQGALDMGVVFCGAGELAHLIDENDAAKLRNHLRFLDSVGFIRCLGLKTYVASFAWRNAAKMDDRWLDLRKKAFDNLVVKPLAGEDAALTKRIERVYGSQTGPADGILDHIGVADEFFEGEKSGGIVINQRALTANDKLVQLVSGVVGDESRARKAVGRWLANIGYVNYCIFKTNHERIIRVVDPHALRRLAFDTKAFNSVFLERYRAFPEISAEGKRSLRHDSKIDVARVNRYIGIIEAFVLSLWREGKDCDMTGASILHGMSGFLCVRDLEQAIVDRRVKKGKTAQSAAIAQRLV